MIGCLIVSLVLTQTAAPVVVTSPLNPKKQVTTTTSGGHETLDVNCVAGCGGAGGGGGSSGDGGATIVVQGLAADGGFYWGVSAAQQGAWNVGVASAPTLNIGDAGVLNVNFPSSQTVNGTVTALQGAGSDGGLWQTGIIGPLNIGDAGVLNVNFPATQTVNGTVTVLQGAGSDGGLWQVGVLGPLNIGDAGVLNVNFPASQTVNGTVTVLQGAGSDGGAWQETVTQGTSPWVENVSQFGGSNISTGTGAAGAGIPRVTISNDSSLAANQSVNVAQVAGATAGTVASGVLKVGIVGSADVAIDAANNGTAPANVLMAGYQLQSGATATAGTAGQVGSGVASLDHVPYARLGGPVTWTCSLDNIGATLTQCQAAAGAGLKYYLTDVVIASTTATAGQFLIRTGTVSNCGTGTASLFPSSASVVRFPYPANTSTIGSTTIHLITPIATPAASAICIICVATNTCTVQLGGYTAP